jgi:hypothetical protein
VTTPLPIGSGFSGNAYGNPSRLRPKAPSRPENVLCLEAVRFRAKQYRRRRPLLGVGSEDFTRLLAYRQNAANLRLSRTKRPQDHVSAIIREGGAPDFPCQLQQTVPVRWL